MIIKETTNTPVCSPQFSDLTEVLSAYRTFKDNDALQMSHLLAFLKLPSTERTEFYSLFTAEVVVISNRYTRQTLSL